MLEGSEWQICHTEVYRVHRPSASVICYERPQKGLLSWMRDISPLEHSPYTVGLGLDLGVGLVGLWYSQ